MQPTWLEDEDGYPRTASVHLGLIVLVVSITFGTVALLLQLYLCLWVLKKSHSKQSLIAFVVMMVCIVADTTLQTAIHESASIALDLLCAASYVTAALVLRADVRAFFRKTEGWEPVINSVFTCLLSAIYINYRLTPGFSMESPLTSLNISSTPASAKITR